MKIEKIWLGYLLMFTQQINLLMKLGEQSETNVLVVIGALASCLYMFTVIKDFIVEGGKELSGKE